MMLKLSIVLLICSLTSAANICDMAGPFVGPSIGFIFDYAPGTAVAKYRSQIMGNLTANLFNTTITAGTNKVIFSGSCNAKLGATVSQPSQGITLLQPKGPTDNSPPPVQSCSFGMPFDPFPTPDDPFNNCWNRDMAPKYAGSDFISALSRMYNTGDGCYGLLNNSTSKPCVRSSGANLPANNWNILVIFWSSPIGQKMISNINKWLNYFWCTTGILSTVQNNYIWLAIVPFVDNNTALIQSNPNEFTNNTNGILLYDLGIKNSVFPTPAGNNTIDMMFSTNSTIAPSTVIEFIKNAIINATSTNCSGLAQIPQPPSMCANPITIRK